MRNTRRRDPARAFSLIELIVATVILAILATVVVPRVGHFVGQARTRTARSDAETIAQQVRLHMTSKGMSSLPGDFELAELTEGDDHILTKNQLVDPWGNQYQIRIPGEINLDFDVFSFGADGQAGGEGEAADIVAGDKRDA